MSPRPEQNAPRAELPDDALHLVDDPLLDALLAVCRLLDRPTSPETGGGQQHLALADLEARYIGHAFFLRVEPGVDDRTPDVIDQAGRHWFWSVIGRSWRIHRDVLAASLLINLFALASPLYIMNLYDRVVPNQAMETLWVLTIAMLIVIGFDMLMRGLRAYFIDLAGKRAEMALSSRICERMLGIRMEARATSVGAFANQIGEFDRLRDFITSATLATLVDLPFMVLFLLLTHWIGGPLVMIPAIGIPLILIYSLIVQWPLRGAVAEVVNASGQKHATLIESLGGLEAIKIMGGESLQQRKWEQLTGRIARASIRSRMLSSSATLFANLVQQGCWLAGAVFGIQRIIAGDMTQGGLIACLILIARSLAPMSQVASLTTRYHQARAALQGLNNIMDMPVERPEGRSFVQHGRLKGAIEFDRVAFSYPQQQQQQAIEPVSFRIKAGERVGIIGRIGSGKTTLGKLLLGLYEPTQGAIRIDGIDLRQIDPAHLRRHIGCASQDVMLFYGTLRENIALGAPWVDDADVLRAAELAGVSDFAARHPLGFDLQVGERGERLSGGQRQSVALARALLLDPPILLLDEPTSSMDNATENRIKKSLVKAVQGKTVLVITHRASLLDLVDRLLVFEDGRMIADGPRDEILEALRQGRLSAGRRG